MNNEISDIVDNTLISIESKLFEKVSNYSVGDLVVFSGAFVKSEKDFFGEQSMTESGSMNNPEFTIRLSNIKRYYE